MALAFHWHSRLNLRDFSKRIGLSTSTVSRALNDYDDVNEETRKKVVAAARRLGYSADPTARRLRSGSSDTIAFVLSQPQAQFANAFFLDMVTGINEGLAESPYHLIVTSAKSAEDELPSFKRLVSKQRVDAIIFSRIHRVDSRIAFLQDVGLPFVTLGRNDQQQPYAFIYIDHEFMGREGCARFVALGHRRIALLNTSPHLMASEYRRRGYRLALKSAGLPFDARLVAQEDLSEDGGLRGARKLLAQPNPPTAILCGHDLIAIGALRAIKEQGRAPGRDVAVIGSDNNPLGRFTDPPLTTFAARMQDAGRHLAEMLLALLGGTPVSELQETWIPELLVRKSDGLPRRSLRRPSGM